MSKLYGNKYLPKQKERSQSHLGQLIGEGEEAAAGFESKQVLIHPHNIKEEAINIIL